MLLFVLVFLIPVLLAYVLYTFFPDFILKMGSTNQGNFIQPVRLLDSAGVLNAADNKPVAQQFFQKKWTFVYLDSVGCNEICIKNLDNQRRVELAQGKEALRVKRIFILVDEVSSVTALQSKLQRFKNLQVFKLSAAVREKFLKQFELTEGMPANKAQRVYLVDPKGRLMMYYKSDTEPDKPNIDLLKGMGNDLKLLLKNSMIG